MGCIGKTLRTPFQPLAHLVDAAAARWLAATSTAPGTLPMVYAEITQSFAIGEHPELTFHGLKFLLTIQRGDAAKGDEFSISVHEIALNG